MKSRGDLRLERCILTATGIEVDEGGAMLLGCNFYNSSVVGHLQSFYGIADCRFEDSPIQAPSINMNQSVLIRSPIRGSKEVSSDTHSYAIRRHPILRTFPG